MIKLPGISQSAQSCCKVNELHILQGMSSLNLQQSHHWRLIICQTCIWSARFESWLEKRLFMDFFLSIQRNAIVIPILGNSCLLPYHFQFNIGHSAVLRAHTMNLKKKVCNGTIIENKSRRSSQLKMFITYIWFRWNRPPSGNTEYHLFLIQKHF